MIKPAEEESILTSGKDFKSKYSTKFPFTFSITLILLSLGLIFLILYYFNRQKENIAIDIRKDLSVIADLKVKQVENWRTERYLDGKMISDNKILANSLLSVFKNTNDVVLKNDIAELFKSICDEGKYLSARLVDESGNIIISYPDDAIKIEQNDFKYIGESKDKGRTLLSDFHFYESTERIHIDLVIPIFDKRDNKAVFLLLEIDPQVNLYPMILTWPAESKSAETLLIKGTGNEVTYLNELRHKKNTALKLKFGTDRTNIISVKALNGAVGIENGLDYRDIPVIAFIKPVPDTEWFLITKIDEDEVFVDINRSSISVTVLILLVILLAGFAIFFYWSRQKERFLKNLLDSDNKRRALISHFDYIFKNANDVFILYDENANVVEVNEKALSLYGYTKEEFIKLDLNALRAPDVRGNISETIKFVKNHPEGLLFETRHIKKDRSIFPVESSTRYMQVGDKYYFQSVVRDISERKQAERALLESERKFSTTFRLSPEAIIITDAKTGKYVDVNQTFLDVLGYNKDEIIGKTSLELDIFSDYRERVRLIKDVMDKGSVYSREIVLKTKAGKILNCLVSSVKIKIGKEWFHISTMLDITERKKAEERIEYLKRIYALLSQINQAIVRIDNKKELFEKICNIAIEFGKFSFAWIGLLDKASNKVLPVAFDGYENGYLEVVKNAKGNDVKTNPFLIRFFREGVNIVTNDIGSDKFHIYDKEDALKRGYRSSGLFPIRENKEVIGLLCLSSEKPNFFSEEEIRLLDEVTMDISFALDYYIKEAQRKETNEALIKSEKKFKSLFDNAGDAILLIDEFKFLEFNKVAEKVYGCNRNEMLFKSPLDFSPENQKDGTPSKKKLEGYFNSAFEGNFENFEWINRKSDGSIYEIEVSLSSVYIGSKNMLMAIVRDISERKKYEEALRKAKEKAEEMNRIKSNFLANMSHELRTPMTGILGFADILSRTLKDPEHRDMADVIYKGGKRLTNTLNMILDLSKIEAEKITVNLELQNLYELVSGSVKLFEAAAKAKDIILKSELKENVFSIVDGRLFEQVLSNLIKNALTYTNEGRITVALSKVMTGGAEYAEVKVTDTGIGIPERSLDLIFEPFRQVSEGWTRSFEGTGLGLTISKKYVEMMKGEISVESKLNEGTVFTIRFKAVDSKGTNSFNLNHEHEKHSEINIPIKKNTLLVEDDELTVMTVTRVLKSICKIDVTNNGFDAIKLAEKNKYELILMDIGLKGMDGLETTKEIRKIAGYKDVPIVAITAYAMEGDREKFFKGGCSHYISKPFSNETLKKLVVEL